MKEAFCNPESIRADVHRHKPPVKLRGSRMNVLAIFRLLDQGHRLKLALASEVRYEEAAGLFAMFKDLLRDRLVMDARPSHAAEDAHGLDLACCCC